MNLRYSKVPFYEDNKSLIFCGWHKWFTQLSCSGLVWIVPICMISSRGDQVEFAAAPEHQQTINSQLLFLDEQKTRLICKLHTNCDWENSTLLYLYKASVTGASYNSFATWYSNFCNCRSFMRFAQGYGSWDKKYYIRFFSLCFADFIISCQKISESPFQELTTFFS